MVGGSCELREFRPDKASCGRLVAGLGSPPNGGLGFCWVGLGRLFGHFFCFDTKTEPNKDKAPFFQGKFKPLIFSPDIFVTFDSPFKG